MMNMKEGVSEFIERGANLTKYYNIGDFVVIKVINVTSQNLIDVTMKGPGLHKLKDGRALRINGHKVPRVIGKQGSMVSMIKQATGCRITVGQNGIVWIQGEPKNEVLAVEAITYIEANAHRSGLTDEMAKWLEKKTGNKVEAVAEPAGQEQPAPQEEAQ